MQNDCCDDTQILNGNPKAGSGRSKRHGKFSLISSLPNPIPDEVSDADEIKKFFEKWNFVPYATSSIGTGHSLLFWYQLLAKMSPTHAACMTKKCTYAFGSAPSTIRAKNPEFDTGAELVAPPLSEKIAYGDALTQFVTWNYPVRQFHRLAGMYSQTDGNVWIELSVSTVLGQTRAHLRLHKTAHVLYLNTAPGEPRQCAVSPIWSNTYLDKHPPRVVPMHPNFTKDKDGTLRSMFHLTDGDNGWYGRPNSGASDLEKYSEVQAAFYRIRNAAGEFTGRLILEMEEENPTQFVRDQNAAAKSAGYSDVVDRFHQEYTERGDDPRQVLVMTRSFGAKPMFAFSVPANNSQGYFKGIGELDENKILISHQCTRRFMSFEVATGFASDAYLEDYVINMEPVIEDFRETILIFTNRILSVVWNMVGRPELDQQSLWFEAPIRSYVDQYKDKTSQPVAPLNVAPNDEPPTNDDEDGTTTDTD